MNNTAPDTIDERIIELLKEDARSSYSQIAKQVGISRVAVRKRIEAMEASGIIAGYKAIIRPAKTQASVQFIMDIETTPEAYEPTLERLKSISSVRQIYSISGECAIHATGLAANARTLEACANMLYREANKGIRRISCKTILSTIMDKEDVPYERY